MIKLMYGQHTKQCLAYQKVFLMDRKEDRKDNRGSHPWGCRNVTGSKRLSRQTKNQKAPWNNEHTYYPDLGF